VAQATFSYEGIGSRVTVESEEDMRWLEEFLVPWFDTSGQLPDISVRVIRDAPYFDRLRESGFGPDSVRTFMMDAGSIDFPACIGPAGCITLYDEKHRLFILIADSRVELVLRDQNASIRLRVMRVLRELAMGVAQLTGGRFLHASAFVLDGHAAIVTGPRRSGKTSLLSYVLANSSAGFLCNDRLLIRRKGETIRLRGMPTIVSMREGTIDLFPGMRQSIMDRGYASRLTLGECREAGRLISFPGKPGRHGLSPRQFCSLLDCPPVKEATGRVLLFPRQTGVAGGLRLRRLQAAEARSRLQSCFFGSIGPQNLSDVFTLLPRGLSRQEAPGDAAVCAGLADSLAAYDCELGNQAYEDDRGAQLLLDLLRDHRILPSASASDALLQT